MEQNYEEFKIKKLFLNILLKKGLKIKAEKIFNNILFDLKKQTKQKPFFILIKAIKKLLPKIKTIAIPKKKKQHNKHFLIFLTLDKQIKKSIIWLFLNSNLKTVVSEIIKTSKNKSKTINTKKKHYLEIKKQKFNLKF